MNNNLPLNHQNINDFHQYEEGTKEYLMEKHNISYIPGDEEGQSDYIGNKNDLRNFFIELEKLENNN